MSRNHSALAYDVAHIVDEMKGLNAEEAYEKFGVELNEDGSIHDPMYPSMTFSSVGEWATFSVEQDNVEYEEHFHG